MLTESYDDALDLMSETVLAAHHSFPALRDTQAFRKFLSTIAIRIQRRKRWRRRLFVPLELASEVVYENTTESSHDLSLLIDALGRLPHAEREAIVLFELSGLSIKEIQEMQGGTVSGVKSRLVRARKRLRHLLVEEPSEQEHVIPLVLRRLELVNVQLQQL